MGPTVHLGLLCLVAVGAVGAPDWVEEYELSAHRATFDADGLTFQDLANARPSDTEAFMSRMKKFEQLRFLRAIEDARRIGEKGKEVSPIAKRTQPSVNPADRRLQTISGGGRAHREAELKHDLLTTGNLPYDKTVPPDSSLPGKPGAQVHVGLNLYHVYAIDTRRATVGLHVWLRLSWTDNRLAWNPADYGGLDFVTFVALPASMEEAQIWVPDVELYSGVQSTYDMPRKEVMVFANGTVFWSRPGEVNSMCNLNGLNDFPFDQIECSLKFGGWSLGGSVQNISYYTDQPINLIQARSATYQETLMVGGSVERGVGHFDCCPDRYGWPYVEFTLIFGRAEKQYDIKIIMMNIALTYLSFAVFLLDPKTGERLQFSVTLLLTIVAADSFVQGVVPVCTPLLWIEWFFMICWFFNVLTIMANTYSHYLYYKAPPEVYASGMPRLATKMEAAYRRFWRQQSDARTQRLSGPGVRMRPPSMAAYAAAAMAPARASSVAPAPAPALSTVHSGDDPTVVRDAASPAPEDSLPARAAGAVKFAAEPSCKPTLTVESAESSPAAERPSGAVAADASEDASQGASSSTRQVPPRWRRLQRMSLFLQGRSGRFGGSGLDRSSSRESERDDAPWSSRQRRYRGTDVHAHRHFEGAFVEAEDLAEAVTATELDPVQAALVRKAFRLLDSMSSMVGEIGPSQMEYFAHHFGRLPKELQETDENQDGLWSIGEFSQLCLRLIKIYGDEKFRVLVEGLLESYAHKMKLHRVYWEGWALWMDYISLFTLPTLYTIALAVLFSWVHRMPPPPGNEHVILSAMQ